MNNSFVLIYHRVFDLEADPQSLAVSPHRFDAQIQYLKTHFSIIPLTEMVARLTKRESINSSIAITFDDGYADNLYYAKPILEKYHVPATFFITASLIGSSREFWWDELERIFLLPQPPLKPLVLNINDHEHRWNSAEKSLPLDVYHQIHRLLKGLTFQEREAIMTQLFAWAGLDREHGRDTHRIVNLLELIELATSDWLEMGSHTLTHPVLSAQSQEVQWQEINESKLILEQITGRQISSFSYPYGQRTDFTPETIQMVKESGYTCGISNIQGNIEADSDCFILPRRIIRNWDIDDFKHHIAQFTGQLELTEKINVYLENIKSCQRELSATHQKSTLQNILFINHFDLRGGAAKLCYHIFESLQNHSFHVSMLVSKKFSAASQIRELPPVNSADQLFLSKFQDTEGWLDVFHYSSFTITQQDEFLHAQLVNLHNLQAHYFSLLALPQLTCLKPVVWTLHDMFALTGHCAHAFECTRWQTGCGNCPHLETHPKVNKDFTHLLWSLKKIVYHYADFSLVCPSKWLKKKVKKSILKHKKVKLIYNGVDETLFKNYPQHEAREQLNLPQDKFILLFMAYGGLQSKIKGGHLIPRILDRLPKEHILLLSIGNSAANAEMNSNYLKTLPYIEDQNQLALYYAAADLFIYPSLADNCPLVVLESLSCGTPVIAFNTGGIPELISHQKTGYIAEYQNETDFTRGIHYFLANPAKLKKARSLARNSVLKKFTLNTMIKKYQELYDKEYRRFYRTPHAISPSYQSKIKELFAQFN